MIDLEKPPTTYQALRFDQGSLHVGEHVVQIPLEALALELLPELHLHGEVANVDVALVQQVVVAVAVEQVLVLVQPHLGHPGQVPLHRLLPVLGELVGVLPSEDVSHPGAGDDLDLPSAHPDLWRDQLLFFFFYVGRKNARVKSIFFLCFYTHLHKEPKIIWLQTLLLIFS